MNASNILNKIRTLSLFTLNFVLLTQTQAALAKLTFQVTYLDWAGYGFEDTTSVATVDGNTGTTLGAQRKIALEYALSLLGNTFDSDETIVVRANFANEGGNATQAVLAYAGPVTQHRNFTGALSSNILYPSALANKLAGSDLAPAFADIEVTFNADLDGPIVFLSDSWYYGLDNTPASSGDVDFVSVAVHELLHGLGFISYVDVVTGETICTAGADCTGASHDIYTHFVETGGATPADLSSLSAAQRATALGNGVSPGAIQWNGAVAQRMVSYLSLSAGTNSGKPRLHAPATKSQGGTLSHLHEDFQPNRLMEASYIEPGHDFSMGAAMLADMGWGTNVVDFNASFSNVTISESNGLYQFSLILENLGPDASSSSQAEISINTKSSSVFSSINPASSSSGTCTTADKLVSCSINALAVGELNTISLVADYQTYAELALSLDTPDVEINLANTVALLGLNDNGGVTISSITNQNENTLSNNRSGGGGGGSISPLDLIALYAVIAWICFRRLACSSEG